MRNRSRWLGNTLPSCPTWKMRLSFNVSPLSWSCATKLRVFMESVHCPEEWFQSHKPTDPEKTSFASFYLKQKPTMVKITVISNRHIQLSINQFVPASYRSSHLLWNNHVLRTVIRAHYTASAYECMESEKESEPGVRAGIRGCYLSNLSLVSKSSPWGTALSCSPSKIIWNTCKASWKVKLHNVPSEDVNKTGACKSEFERDAGIDVNEAGLSLVHVWLRTKSSASFRLAHSALPANNSE